MSKDKISEDEGIDLQHLQTHHCVFGEIKENT